MSLHEQFAEDLALYALGALDGAELQTLEKHLEECASCRRELELLRGDSSLLALITAGPKPPSRARERLMFAIAEEPRQSARDAGSKSRQRSWWGSFAWPALQWVAALTLVAVGIGLLRQNSALRQDIASLRNQFSEQGNQLEQVNQTMVTLLDPEAMKIELVAVGKKPEPRGKAIYERRNRNLIFFASNLPPLPADKIYELWLFPASGGAPIAAGLFKPDARGSATVVNPPLPEGVAAKNFAVTLEPESGSHAAPRGTPVIVGVGE
jgi:anti-sigma-K factor RskA